MSLSGEPWILQGLNEPSQFLYLLKFVTQRIPPDRDHIILETHRSTGADCPFALKSSCD